MTVAVTRPPLPVLTGLRFFAAAEVVVFHASGEHYLGTWFYGLTAAGYAAVAFFFVLSGFILTYVYSGPGPRDGIAIPLARFMRARLARIGPAYVLGLAIALPFFLYSIFVSHMFGAAVAVASGLLTPVFLQSWLGPMALVWNAPAWSLSAEMFFYLCFPVLARAAARLSLSSLMALALALVLAAALVRHAITPEPNAVTIAGYFPLLHLPAFILGMATGRIFLYGKALSPPAHAAFFALGAAGVILIWLWRPYGAEPVSVEAALCVLYALTIFGAARAEALPRFMAARPLIVLGEASYAIYILHWPLYQWWNWATRGLALWPPLSLAGFFAVLIPVALVVMVRIERPLRRRILGHREHRDA